MMGVWVNSLFHIKNLGQKCQIIGFNSNYQLLGGGLLLRFTP